MFKSYLLTAWRNLLRDKLYSTINIMGLSIGITACLLITLFILDELSYDTFWDDHENIYRFQRTFISPQNGAQFPGVTAPGPAKERLLSYFSDDIAKTARLKPMDMGLKLNENNFDERIVLADIDALDIFSFETIEGNLHAALNENTGMAISESFARKHFGASEALGQVVTLTFLDVKRDFQIQAVYKDLPHNTVLDIPAMIMISEGDFQNHPRQMTSWLSPSAHVFFKLKDGVGIKNISDRLDEFSDRVTVLPKGLPEGLKGSEIIQFNTLALKDAQLKALGKGEMKPRGSMTMLFVFIAIAALILIIACINFINLSTAKATKRAKEVALRKVAGATRQQLVIQFIGEALLLALVSMVVGIMLTELALPLYSDFIGRPLSLSFHEGPVFGTLLTILLIIGSLGGIYPAFILSSFLPAKVLKANKSTSASGSRALRSTLTVLQFTISISLMVATAVVYSQLQYSKQMDPGFDKENLIVVKNLQQDGAKERQEAFQKAIQAMPNVVNASLTKHQPFADKRSSKIMRLLSADATNFPIVTQGIDPHFLETYNIPLLAGRNYNDSRGADGIPNLDSYDLNYTGELNPALPTGTVLINEAAVKKFGLETAEKSIGKSFLLSVKNNKGQEDAVKMEIIGVIPNIHFQSMQRIDTAELYTYPRDELANLTVRFTGDPREITKQIDDLWKNMISASQVSYEFIEDTLAEGFSKEQALGVMLMMFSMVAILIACFGLYGLAAFSTDTRKKEIGVRKVLGAKVLDIVRLLLWQFSKPVLLANLIAWPLSTWVMLQWLETFPYRMEEWLLLPLCLIAGSVALLIAWITVGGNAAKVARRNPIDALKYE